MKLRTFFSPLPSVAVLAVALFFLAAATTYAQTDGNDTSNTVPADRARDARPANTTRPDAAPRQLDRSFFDRRTDGATTNADLQRRNVDDVHDKINAVRSEREEELERKREEIRNRLEERQVDIEQKRDEIQQRLSDRRADLQESAKERIKAYIERMTKRFEAAITRLEQLSERILSRIEKFEENGVDMTQARELLEIAETELIEAREAVRLFTAEANGALANESDVRATFGALRELLTDAKNSIKAAHAALVDAIRAIKASADIDDTDEENEDETNDSDE